MDTRGQGTHWILDYSHGQGWVVMYTGTIEECRVWFEKYGHIGETGDAYYFEPIPKSWDGLLGIVCFIPEGWCF